MKKVTFFDGVSSSTVPIITGVESSKLTQYADDAAFEAIETPVAGSIYFNTTSDKIRFYDGAVWLDVADSADVGQLASDILDNTTDITNLQTDVTAIQTNVGTLQTDVSSLQTDVGTLQTNVGALQTDVAGLQTDVTQLQTDSTQLLLDVGTLQTEVGQLQTDVTAAQTDINNAELRLDDLELALPAGDNYLELEELNADPTAAATGKQRLFARDDGKIYKIDDTGDVKPVGSGGPGGGFNLELDPYAQEGVGTWALYNDASATPVDLTGGTATATFTTLPTSTVILSDAYQGVFQLVKPSSNVQGEGVAKLYNIPAGVRAQGNVIVRVRVSPDVAIALGDFKLAAYDVDNARLLPTFGLTDGNIPAVDANGQLRLTVRIPVESTTTQIRLGFHVATTNTTAVNLRFSDLSVGVDSVVDVPIIGEEQTYTPVLTGFTVSGVNALNVATFKRIGNNAEIKINTRMGATGTASGIFSWSLPPNLTLDNAKLNVQSSGTRASIGTGLWFDRSALEWKNVIASVDNPNSRLWLQVTNAGGSINVDNTVAPTNSDDSFSITISVPILEWSNQSAIISTTEAVNQTARFSVFNSGATTVSVGTSPTKITTFNTIAVDTVNGWSSANQEYTIRESGSYLVSASVRFTPSATSISTLGIFRNGVNLSNVSSANITLSTVDTLSATRIFNFNAGDVIDLRGNVSSGTAAAGDFTPSSFSITRIPDFTTFGIFTNTVAASYRNTAAVTPGDSLANRTTAIFTEQIFDTNNIYNVSTGIGTIPETGTYVIDAKLLLNRTSGSIGDPAGLVIEVNNVLVSDFFFRFTVAGTSNTPAFVLYQGRLNKGDTFRVRSYVIGISGRENPANTALNLLNIRKVN